MVHLLAQITSAPRTETWKSHWRKGVWLHLPKHPVMTHHWWQTTTEKQLVCFTHYYWVPDTSFLQESRKDTVFSEWEVSNASTVMVMRLKWPITSLDDLKWISGRMYRVCRPLPAPLIHTTITPLTSHSYTHILNHHTHSLNHHIHINISCSHGKCGISLWVIGYIPQFELAVKHLGINH